MATATGAAAPITGPPCPDPIGNALQIARSEWEKAVPNARRKTEAGRLKATAVPSNT